VLPPPRANLPSFVHLVQHRFASHCCEALFIQAAPVVAQELSKPDLITPPSSDPNDVVASMENLFLFTLDELEGYLGYLVTERFASHVLRVLLVVLSGTSLERQGNKSTLHSKKKEKVAVPAAEKQDLVLGERKVPQSFTDALQKVISDSVANLDTNYLQMLATHPTGNPTLQLMLKLELTLFGKVKAKDENSIIRKLLPDDPIREDTPSAAFINGLVYDAIGSRLLETIIDHAPGKLFKSIYRQFFVSRMGSLARNEIAGYVAGRILERLSKDDLEEACRQIIEQIPNLVERNRTAIIKTLVERCVVRGVDTVPIAAQLQAAYGGSSGFEITRLLKLGEAPSDDGKSNSKHDHPQPDKVHGSLLAQTMMTVDGPLGNLIFDSFTNLGDYMTMRVARDPAASRTLQAALVSPNASVIFRRKVIQQFYGHVGELALDPAGSHVVDSIWAGLAFIRERIAEELAENEAALRESHVGRAVWRNWRMDLYKRRRVDWVKQARYTAGNDGFLSFPESNDDTTPSSQGRKDGGHLSAIELARKKWADSQAAKAKLGSEKAKRDAKEARKENKEQHEKSGKHEKHSSSKGKEKAKASVAAH
jgi:nucleolar protein 9